MKATQNLRDGCVAAPPAVLIAATSGRALAACARRGGYRPLVADLFGDLDTIALSEASERISGSLGFGLEPTALLAALDRLAAGRCVIGIVAGNGFEDRLELLRALAARHVLLGNPPDVVAAMKDPRGFAALCARAGVPHPEVRADRPPEGAWLRKRIGGSGGTHIVAAPLRVEAGSGQYYQRRVAGAAVSAAFLAAGGSCQILGLSRQWANPGSRRPFRYGGASRPAVIGAERETEIHAAVARLVKLTALRGLNSADFLVRDDGIDLLEVNPRPGATLDIFADRDGDLFRLHLDACNGVLHHAMPAWPAASAAAIVYAPAEIRVVADFVWPDWSADRRSPSLPAPRGTPLCTVLAEAADAATAELLVHERAHILLDALSAGSP